MTSNADAGYAINGRFLVRRSTGVERFARELLRAWLPLGAHDNAQVLTPPAGDLASTAEIGARVKTVGRTSGHSWEQFELPAYCRERMLINLCNTAPVIKRRQLAVLHDASVMANPRHYSLSFRSWYRILDKALMQRSSVIATVSKFSASELTHYFGDRANGIEVIYESGEHILATTAETDILDRLGIRGQRYVLGVGSQTPNKNFQALAQMAGRLSEHNVKIVAAGGGNNSSVFSNGQFQSQNIIRAGYVSNGELRALYENAECFVFPSFYEGFGLPPLEAMHCGCPVLASRRAAIPEICGDAAVYCEPDNPVDVYKQLHKVLTSAKLKIDMREAGYLRTSLFTWRKSAETLNDILQRSERR